MKCAQVNKVNGSGLHIKISTAGIAFTGSNDFESYVTCFELLAKLQKWKRTETGGSVRAAREIGERPPYFGFRLQKSAIEFYESLPQNVRDSYDEFVKAFPNN